MIIDLIDGTYELFRHFSTRRCSLSSIPWRKGSPRWAGPIENFPALVLGDQLEPARLFKRLATLRTDAKLFRDVDELRWRGPTRAFAAWTERIGAPRLLQRSLEAQARSGRPGPAH